MTIIKGTCKFCKKPLDLKFDDEYAKRGDPYKLVKLACCDHCGDYMNAKGLIFDRIRPICLRLLGGLVGKDDLPKARESLVSLCKRYMRLEADYRRQQVPMWEEAIIDDIMSKPGNYATILSKVPMLFSQGQLV